MCLSFCMTTSGCEHLSHHNSTNAIKSSLSMSLVYDILAVNTSVTDIIRSLFNLLEEDKRLH